MPPPNLELFLQTTATGALDRGGSDTGQVTYEVTDPRQLAMLRRLVSRLYGSVPALENADRVEVTIDFYSYCQKLRMPVDAEILVRAQGRTLGFSEHPCVGEFLLNADIYRIRRRLFARAL